jgi:hypothetical protein
MSCAWKGFLATIVLLPNVAMAGSCDRLQFNFHPEISELLECVKELQSSFAHSQTMTSVLDREVELLETQLCLMSHEMKNEDAAARIAIFCLSKAARQGRAYPSDFAPFSENAPSRFGFSIGL